MSTSRLQLVKWSFPAFALILGLLWYKRRRVDRADPGGTTKVDRDRQNRTSKASLNLHDSGIHIDESPSLTGSRSPTAGETAVCSPRRVSESLDIPSRKSTSLSISIKSGISSGDDQAWYKDVESVPEGEEIRLSSNPKSVGRGMLSRGRPPIAPFEVTTDTTIDNRVTNMFESAVAREEPIPASESNPPGATPEIDNDKDGTRVAEQNSDKSVARQSSPGVTKCQGRAVSERDSANHSPMSGVLEGSVTDEARSEGSTDSGKGGSIKGHAKDSTPTVYEFAVPQNLVGRLIGRHGSFLQNIRTKAEVNIIIKRHPTAKGQKICAIEGSPDGIGAALDIIRQMFPEKKYPMLTLEQVSFLRAPEEIPWSSELMHLALVEGVNNDVVVCNILKPNHLFVHLPTHPTYPSLRILDENITLLYDTTESPAVPDQLTRGMIVVAKLYSRWVRVYVENPDPNGERHLVRLVDHGGFWIFSNAEMRKIRSDYLMLPFQAIEVFLANIQAKDGEWKQEAYDVVAQVCSGIVGQAQIEGYINSSTYVNLYLSIPNHGIISLADELVARGLAEPVALECIVPEEEIVTP